jgi:hypothetical protein
MNYYGQYTQLKGLGVVYISGAAGEYVDLACKY